jgi:hypothetical protein
LRKSNASQARYLGYIKNKIPESGDSGTKIPRRDLWALAVRPDFFCKTEEEVGFF